MMKTLLAFLSLLSTAAFAQHARLRPAEPISLPGYSDSNSPSHWSNGIFNVFQSAGLPIISQGTGQFARLKARAVALDNHSHVPLWIEATWADDDGTVYAWYHNEVRMCGGQLSIAKIGALVSHDGGTYFEDLGIILESGYPYDCAAQNGYFAGGHGDFTVLLDATRQFFYFYFGNYSGPPSSQGVAAARMAFADRQDPVGRVWKYFRDGFREHGLRGRVTPLLPARAPWNAHNTDSFWGPSLHWNTFLNRYVMILNRSCCEPGWPSEGIYVSFSPDPGNPELWTEPKKILDRARSSWYPMVIGLEEGMTDKVAGETARFYLGSESNWEIVFSWQEALEEASSVIVH